MNPGSAFNHLSSIAPRRDKVRNLIERPLKTTDRRRAEIEFHELARKLAKVYGDPRAVLREEYQTAAVQELRRLAQEHFQARTGMPTADAEVARTGLWPEHVAKACENLMEDLSTPDRSVTAPNN